MHFVRMNYIEYSSKEVADEMEAKYVSVASDGFPDAKVLVFLRTDAMTATLCSIYPDKATYDRATEERKNAYCLMQIRLRVSVQRSVKQRWP